MHADQNPYAPGSGVRPPLLAGRDEELGAFDDLVSRTAAGRPGRGVVLTGLRGIGKTVLLDRMRDRASDAGWLVVELEGQSRPSGRACVRRQLAHGLALAARRLRGRGMTSRAATALAAVRSFGIAFGGVSVDLGVEPAVGRADTGVAEIDLQETVEDLAPALTERGTALLVVVDEVQDVDLDLLGALLTVQHRAVQRGWPFFVTAAGLPNSPAVLCDARSYAGRMFAFRQVGPLPRTSAESALRDPARAAGVLWDDDAARVVLDAADGYPIHLQTFAACAWATAVDGGTITRADAEAGVERGQAELDAGFFPGWWDRASEQEQQYLRRVARAPGTAVAVATVEAAPAPAGGWASVRRSLCEKGLLFMPGPDRVALTVPRLDSFVDGQAIPDEGG
ncbi:MULTISPECIES: ATP-binding protein [unclassified Curtobacterium]|uniref:ATP-binding protein n=1 Tax=unclassified Curtobacterium TaxID=257496 RepID=UPI0011B7B47C|nr:MULTISPECIES: ATP-binding protein [unclassified Curtobacterium]WIB35853.1 ATP-binding protein [Curtobacterium sp. MCJR17_043]